MDGETSRGRPDGSWKCDKTRNPSGKRELWDTNTQHPSNVEGRTECGFSFERLISIPKTPSSRGGGESAPKLKKSDKGRRKSEKGHRGLEIGQEIQNELGECIIRDG